MFVFTLMGSALVAAHAQSPDRGLEVGGHVTVLRLGELGTTDTGVGANATWRAASIVALDGTHTWFPGDNTASVANRIANQGRVLGLVGARSGIRRGPIELFARARGGFLRFAAQ